MLNKIKKLRGFTPHLLVGEKASFSSLKKKGEGFTLIELLVVIAIIGLLSTLAIVALSSAREKARDSKRVTDIRQIQTALEIYFNDQESYPNSSGKIDLGSTENAVGDKDCEGKQEDCTCLDSDGFEGVTGCSSAGTDVIYMGQVPANPLPSGATYTYEPRLQGGTCASTDSCDSYRITFTLEGKVNELSAGPHTAKPSGIE